MRRPRLRRRRPELGEEAPPPKPLEDEVGPPTPLEEDAPLPKRERRIKAPRLPRPRLPSQQRLGELASRRLPRDMGFRISTRIKAVGYGAREQAWRVSRGAGHTEDRIMGVWRARSTTTRRRIVAVTVVLGVYALVKFAALPGIPCEVSAAKECAPGDDAVALVPSTALLYSHLTLDDDAGQFDQATEVAGRIPRSLELGQFLLDQIRPPSGTQITYPADIKPWAGDDAALAILPAGNTTKSVVMLSIDNQKGAEAFIKKVSPGPPTPAEQNGVKYNTYEGGFASAIDHGFVLVGGQVAVRAAIAIGANDGRPLEADPVAKLVRDELPENRFADVYVSATGVTALLAGSTSTAATQLETFVNFGATRGFGAAAVARDKGVEFDLVSSLDPKKTKRSPSFFSALPKFRPALTDDVGARALGYVGIGELGPSLGTLLQRAGSAQPGLAQSLTAFTKRLDAETKVDPTRDLLPALGGQAAIVAEPTDGIPFASVIVDGVDEKRARDVLARLQAPIARSIQPQPGTPAGAPPPAFQTASIDGVEASSIQVSPSINLTYAVFDGKLVVSTDPAGVTQVVQGGKERLEDSEGFVEATEPLPDELSALVFLNLDELLDLAEALGRVEDPVYASFRDDIRKLHAIALGVNADPDLLRSRLFLTIN